MTQVQASINSCIAQIIQQNSVIENIFHEIYDQGGRVLLVGGAVRDCLLSRFTSDLDFEVYHLTLKELEIILQKFGPVSFVGKSFGVLRLHGLDVDWSLPRKDSSGRKPKVEVDPDMNFDQAFKRRDLTINAMGIDVKSKELIDPFGGLQDLEQKVLRSPDLEFFQQDPLRLFRVMQFASRLQMNVDQKLSELCRSMDVSHISGERVESEFKKLWLKSAKPSVGLRWMDDIGRLAQLFPDIVFDQQLYDALDCLVTKNLSDEQQLFAMWGFVAHKSSQLSQGDILVDQSATSQGLLKIKKSIRSHVHSKGTLQKSGIVAWYLFYIPQLVELSKPQAAYKWLAYWIQDSMNLQFLSEIGSCWYSQEMIQKFVQQAKQASVLHQAEESVVTGKDVQSLSLQGKEIGQALGRAYELQINEGLRNKKALLKKIF